MTKSFGFILSVFVVCILYACHENHFNPNSNLSRDSYAALTDDNLRMSKTRIAEQIGKLIREDDDTMAADYYARSHYLGDGSLLWMTRDGIDTQADTLLKYLHTVESIGFDERRFYVRQIENDLRMVRELDFSDSGDDDINVAVARLDYNLTKAYLRFAIGQRYGFMNPRKVFNRIDRYEHDSTMTRFRQLYDVPTETFGNKDCARVLRYIHDDSVGVALKECEPRGQLYLRLKSMLASASEANRMKILVNMERCRWRHDSYSYQYRKHVVVNIPSYHLTAVDGDEVLEMKVVCGSQKTKTPLLNSRIMRMDVNPKWNIPTSIIKHEMSRHAGDADYFNRNNYVIRDRSTGERVEPELVTVDDLRKARYRVVQDGGEGNALGRIIFRFNNNLSIYLHDTSSKGTFDRMDRRASHGCIRVEKPFELARFLLDKKDSKTLDRLSYSMTVRTKVPETGDENMPEYKIDKSRLVHSISVKPQIPLFITYFTMWLTPDNQVASYADVYGYDDVIAGRIKEYVKH